MRPLISIFFFILVCTNINCFSQVDPIVFEKVKSVLKGDDLESFNKGRSKLEQESYLEALTFFEKIITGNPNLVELKYIAGICYCYDVNHYTKALDYIYQAKARAEEIDVYNFNLAYALEKNDSTKTALAKYTNLLEVEEKKPSKSETLISEINYRINRCKKIIEYKNKQNFVKISDLGPPIDSDASEYCPLITSNESIMIFTYRGPKSKGGKQKLKNKKNAGGGLEMYFEDIFMSKKINDTLWSEPHQVDNLNTLLHDAAVSLSADGTQLFVYRNLGKGKGDLYLSNYVNNTFSLAVYQAGLSSDEWDGSACFIPNSNKVIFASERKDGFGGKDLYIAEKLKTPNAWGNIKNLGPVINSKYDEDAPFVTADGKILFFSSNNGNSLGGYDILRSDIKNGEWQTPYNLGAPINTKNDDKFFTVRADGKVGYYSSYKQGGKGDQDIYKVEPGIPGKPIELLEVNGFVSVDGKPAAASVEIYSVLKNTKFTNNVNSDKNTGNFLSDLPAGDNYELVIKVDKFPQQIIDLNALGIDSFVVLNVFAEFTSPEYDKKLAELISSNADAQKDAGFDKEVFASKYGKVKKEGLAFKVQIGAFKFMENFNYNNVMGFPKIIRHTDDDYITRFIMGHFETYNEALELLKNIKKTPVLKDAFIIANYKGQKKYLHELVAEKIVE